MYFNLPFGIRVSRNNPIDEERYIVADISERDLLITNNRAFEGLQVYIPLEGTLYILRTLVLGVPASCVWEIINDKQFTITGTTNQTLRYDENDGWIGSSIIMNDGSTVSINGRVDQTGLGGSTFFGDGAGFSDDLTNNNNSAFGYQSLYYNINGSGNTSIGYQSGMYIYGGTFNTGSTDSIFIGSGTRPKNNNETNQIVIGTNAIGNGDNSVTIGNNNITKTLLRGDVGIDNSDPTQKLDVNGSINVDGKIFLNGNQVGYLPTTFNGTFILGNGGNNLSHSGANEGYYNTFVGISVGINSTKGSQNTAVGYTALNNTTLGEQNTTIGLQSLYTNTTGSYNTASGMLAGSYIIDGVSANTAGSYSLFLGHNTRALADAQTNQIVIGANAIGHGSNTVTLGNDLITYTYLTGKVISSGMTISGITEDTQLTTKEYVLYQINNIDLSMYALLVADNLFIGTNTFQGRINQTGLGDSTFFGEDAGKNDTLSNNKNSAFGYQTLYSNTIGTYNSAFGYQSLYSNTGGTHNTSIGYQSFYSNMDGSNNTSIGYQAGMYVSGGTFMTGADNSVFIGSSTKSNDIGETNQIVIGYNAVGNGSNSTVIGNSNITQTSINGKVLVANAIGRLITENYQLTTKIYVDTSLSTSISGETSSRISGDELLSTSISTETSLRTSVDNSLSTSLSTHNHYQLYQPDGSNPFVYTDNGGSLHIDGSIIQSGINYETHAEQLYTEKDMIILRDGAVGSLGSGYTGLIAKLYDGANDGQLVFDSGGTARVGDIGSLQPLATRIETPVNGNFAYWDSGNTRLDFKSLSISDVNTLSSTLSTESSSRISGDELLSTSLSSESSSLTSSISSETSSRTSVDTSLSTSISTNISTVISQSNSNYVNKSGDTMAGDLTLLSDVIITKLSGTTTRTVVVGDDGTLLTGTTITEIINNYYCSTWGEVQSAVTDINTNFNGGNIYVSGTIAVPSGVTWDLTNINFYGFNALWKFLDTDFEANGSLSKTITITSGNPTFYNIRFTGSGGGSLGNLFSAYTTRQLFDISSGNFSITFDNCSFTDIIGGTGSNPVIGVSSIDNTTGCKLTFSNCSTFSHNNSLLFNMNGFRINRTDTVGTRDSLTITVYNQQTSLYNLASGGTEFAYYIDTNNTATTFISDSTAWLLSQNAGNQFNSITITNELVSASSDDLLMISDTSDYGNIKYISKTNLGIGVIPSGSNTSKTITQVSHGFVVNDVIKFSGSTYQKAQADIAENAEIVGVVSNVDGDNFTFVIEGYIDGLNTLTSDNLYFLSPTTPGLLTETEPSEIGQISKPILKTVSTTSGIVFNYRGMEIAGGNPSNMTFQTVTDSGNTTNNNIGIGYEVGTPMDTYKLSVSGTSYFSDELRVKNIKTFSTVSVSLDNTAKTGISLESPGNFNLQLAGHGQIQAVDDYGSGVLSLNPLGGPILIGTSTWTSGGVLQVEGYSFFNGTVSGTSFNNIVGLSDTNPLSNGSVNQGSSTLVSRQDHIHPIDSTISTSISIEVGSRISGDNLLSTSISTEVDTRGSTDTSLSTAISLSLYNAVVSLSGLTDVTLSSVNHRDYLVYNSGTTQWENEAPVNITANLLDGQFLYLNGEVISGATIDVSGITASISTETSTRGSADTSLSTSISSSIVQSNLNYVNKTGDTMSGDLNINGTLTAIVKSFVIDHPTELGKKLQYGSLESPYHGVRLTGEDKLTDGKCIIKLPDYIRGLCHQIGAQVQITNIKHGEIIWVEYINVDNNEFMISSNIDISDTNEYRFYWSFTAVRKDVDKLTTEFNI